MSLILRLRIFEYFYTHFVLFCNLTTVVHRENMPKISSDHFERSSFLGFEFSDIRYSGEIIK